MKSNDADYRHILKIVDRGNYGFMEFPFKYPVEMNEEESLERFTKFREVARLPVPCQIGDRVDRYEFDLDERAQMRNDLDSRKNKPGYGLWFEDHQCQMCGSTTDRLVQDHCHWTGLARGTLCATCNQEEGRYDHPRWRAWRLLAPELEVGKRWIYRRECWDCDHNSLMTMPIHLLIDYHRWVQAENHNRLMNTAQERLFAK